MRIGLRILAVIVIVVANLVTVLNVAQMAGLWYGYGQSKATITGALAVSDHFLLQAEPFMNDVEGVIGSFAQLGAEFDSELNAIEPTNDSGLLAGAENLSKGVKQATSSVQAQIALLRSNVGATEQTIAQLIPRIPTYVNLTGAGLTALLLWRVFAQAALICLAVLYLRSGGLGRKKADSRVEPTYGELK